MLHTRLYKSQIITAKNLKVKYVRIYGFYSSPTNNISLLHTDFSLIVTFEASLLFGVLSNLGRGMRGSLSPSKFGRKTMGGASYKEVDETSGLIESESSEDEDEEVRLINGFDIALPVTLQANIHLTGR